MFKCSMYAWVLKIYCSCDKCLVQYLMNSLCVQQFMNSLCKMQSLVKCLTFGIHYFLNGFVLRNLRIVFGSKNFFNYFKPRAPIRERLFGMTQQI